MRLLLLLLLISCSTTVKKEVQESPTVLDLNIPGSEIVIQPIQESLPATDFTYRSSLDYIPKVASAASCVLKKKSFQEEVASIKSFASTKDNGEEVLKKLLPAKANITTYYKRFSSVLATTYLADKDNIYFNTRNNPRPMPDMINTAIHEKTHLVGYSHATNKPSKANEDSVPYKVGDIAEKHAGGCY